ncbi:glycosyltransferase [Oscillatoria salina]|uniref:glycosyltransferase n=1 Tax=Oscillatoria salina TaxID=331517 RepID=UPI0013B91E37|nr:glycosyltransferase [Oscillatoria salina]MBZ8179103.1 glycosyltransferase [Oscillatoria salina IIICB1]NET87024.1 glycosyltransferase [Kamptonema sp. SIO1D9]
MGKVAIFLSSLEGGGAERVMLNLAEGFCKNGLGVDLILVKREGSYLTQIPANVKVINLEKKRLLQSLPALVNYLKKERPLAVLSALEDTNLVALGAKFFSGVSTQVVVTVHNTLSQESRNATSLKRKIIPYVVSWFYPWADAVIAVSQGVAKDLTKLGLRSRNLKVIYNPIVTPQMKAKIQQPPEHSWLAPGEPPVILGVGRLTKQKDFSTLIEAFAKVRQQQPARLIILGEGAERLPLETLAQKLGVAKDLDFPGFVDNPYAYMAGAAVLVLSSAWEGFGNVLVESMLAGTPVVSTNCESGPAEILANGKYGKLVPVGDSEAMAKAIAQTLAESPDSKLLQKRALDFSLEKALSQYQQLLPLN